MGGEMVVANNSCEIDKICETINTLVVDDDTTCVVITAALLRKSKYKVATVKNAKDALRILRTGAKRFDLVVTDVYMPEINGFELQQVIAKEFGIPVVFMSADEKNSTTIKGLEGGAAYFLHKPISLDDVRDIWQYAITQKRKKNKVKSVVTEEIQEDTNSLGKSSSGPHQKSPHEVVVVESSSLTNEKGNEESNNEESSERGKSARKHEEAKKEDNDITPSKKAKLVWTDSLHSRFLTAITELGLDNALPRRILEVMNVPELTRENVASHLQKYRIFLRKVTKAGVKDQAIDSDSANSPVQSTSASNRLSQISPESIERQRYLFFKNRMYNALQGETSNRVNSSFPKRLAPITLPGYGKTELVPHLLSTSETADNISTQLLNAATSAQQLITGNVNSAADTETYKNPTRRRSFIGSKDKELASLLTRHITNPEARTMLPPLPNKDGSGAGGRYGQLQLVSNKGDSSKITFSNANQLSTREAADNISTQLLNAATSAQRITGNLNSVRNNNSAAYTEAGQRTDLVARVTNFESDKEFVELLTHHINQKLPSIGDNSLGETSNLGNSSFPKRLAITLPGYGQTELVPHLLSTSEAPDNISTQLQNAATLAQQLITGNVSSTADTEVDQGVNLIISGVMNLESSQSLARRDSSVTGFQDKEFASPLTNHITQNASVELPPIPECIVSGAGGSGTTLDPYYDFSMLGNINPTPNSGGMVYLTNTFLSQLNVLPSNLENNYKEGTTLNFIDGINQDQQVYLPWTDHTLAEQGDHRGVTTDEGLFQLPNVSLNLEVKQENYGGVTANEGLFQLPNAALNPELQQGNFGGVTADGGSFHLPNVLLNSELEQENYGGVTANEGSFQLPNAALNLELQQENYGGVTADERLFQLPSVALNLKLQQENYGELFQLPNVPLNQELEQGDDRGVTARGGSSQHCSFQPNPNSEQGDHRGVTTWEGPSQLGNVSLNPESEQGVDNEFWKSIFSSSPDDSTSKEDSG